MKAFAGVDSDPRPELIVVGLDGIAVKCLQLTKILSLSHGEHLIRYAVERERRRMILRPAQLLVVSPTDSVSMPDTSDINAPWNSGRIYPAANLVNGAPNLKLHTNKAFLVS